MCCSASRWTPRRPFLLGSLLVLCFICLFISYKADITYPDFGRLGRFCPAFLCAEKAQTHESPASSSTELHHETHWGLTEKLQAAAVDAEPDTVVLVWMWPFGFRFELNCHIFNITRCHLTDNKELYRKAHGVIFHHRDIQGNLENMPKGPRPVFQKWVWSNMESPTNSRKTLQKEFSCKFYLSFENSVHSDYITEKFFNPLTWGSVPVVMGPPRRMYEGHAPAESFIHVEDFPSPKELAERLLSLDQNQTEYMRFFNWRSVFKVKPAPFGVDIACKTCRYLQTHTEYQTFNDLNTWYWG
ncbi:LOW QUALITY PROTEIN: 4-galactosyl-N-acetylglucosaminide 3-alpha-L-fucosyltransferase 9-like [Spinachia spinachia]